MGVHVHVFARLVRNAVKASGMPSARQAFVPTPLMNTSPQGLREYVEGNDPIHGRPFMAEVFDQLTRPVPADELRGEDWDRSTPRYVEADGEEEMHALFQERRYTDFLPIVLPTEERVERMLTGTSHAPDEMVGKLRPTIGMEYWHFDVEKVAVNAVMAGAAPEHFPVILALASSGDTGRQSSMSSMGNMVLVNGPIRHEIGDEQRRRRDGAVQPRERRDRPRVRPALPEPPGRLGAGRHLRRLAGLQLLLQLHHLRRERGGEPLGAVPRAVGLRQGRERRHGVVHLGQRLGGVPARLLGGEAQAMICGLEPGMGCTLVLDPIVAREFCERGFDTKEKIAEWIHENARIPQRRYWDHVMLNLIHEEVEAGVEPFASYWNAPPDELIPVFETNRINIVVAGGETNGHFSIFMGGPMRAKFRTNKGQNATVSIDAWR